MLQDDTKRPWSLKQRILSRHGHLSNVAAAEAAAEIASSDLRHIYLGHLSRDCNSPELAFKVVQDRLDKIGARHIRIENTQQRDCQFHGTQVGGQMPAVAADRRNDRFPQFLRQQVQLANRQRPDDGRAIHSI